MTMITPSYLGETIEYSSLHACRSTLEDPTLAIAYFTSKVRGAKLSEDWVRNGVSTDFEAARGKSAEIIGREN